MHNHCGGSTLTHTTTATSSNGTTAIGQLIDHISLSSIKPFISISISRRRKTDWRACVCALFFRHKIIQFERCCCFSSSHFNCFICFIHRSIYDFNWKSTLKQLNYDVAVVVLWFSRFWAHTHIHFRFLSPIKIYSVSVRLNWFNLEIFKRRNAFQWQILIEK